MLGSGEPLGLALHAMPFVNSRQFVLPPPGRARVARAYAQAALDEAVGLGLALPGGAGVAGESLPVADYLALLQAGQALRPDFGLRVGARMRTAHFVAYGQVLLSCATFGDALRQTQRFEALAHDLGRSELQVQGELAEYRWLSPWAAGCAALPLSVLAGIQAFGSWMAQRPLAVHGIDLPFAMPAQPEWSERLQQQLGAPLRFGAAHTAARFDAALLAEPIPSSDPAQLPLLQQHAEALLAQRGRQEAGSGSTSGSANALAAAVVDRLPALLAQGEARLDAVALGLSLSPRTLQRRLAAEGRPFQQLLDATRRQLAAQYLRDVSLSLTEVAFLLGYAEQSSFSHAHRAWHGCSPQAWRSRWPADPVQLSQFKDAPQGTP